jgi:hypothetical protein
MRTGSASRVYAVMFGVLAYLCWRLRERYSGDVDTALAGGALFFAGLVVVCIVADFRDSGISGRFAFVVLGFLLLLGLPRADLFPYARAALVGVGALFALAYVWPSSPPCPACGHRRCRCYATRR